MLFLFFHTQVKCLFEILQGGSRHHNLYPKVRRVLCRELPLGKGCAKSILLSAKAVDGRPRRDSITRSLPCATHKYSQHRKSKKKKKTRQAGARLRQATTTPSSAVGPPFPTPAPRQRRHHHHIVAAHPSVDRCQRGRMRTPHEEGGRTAGHTPVGKEADGARSLRA
jgi:hypothetical protein